MSNKLVREASPDGVGAAEETVGGSISMSGRGCLVPKTNRKKKADRAKAAAKRAQQDRRRAAVTAEKAASDRRDRLRDPATPVAELRALVAEEYGQTPFAGGFARMMLRDGFSLETLATVADFLVEDQPQGLGALMFAAAISHGKGDERGEHELIERALALAETQDRADAEEDSEPGDPWSVRWSEVLRGLTATGHPGEAIELLEPYLREHPDDDDAADVYGVSIERAFEEGNTDGDRAAVARFADRSAFVELREAVAAWVAAHPEWAAAVELVVGERLEGAAELELSGPDRAALEAFAHESALWSATLNEADDDSGALLKVFAADPDVAPDLRARAATWADLGHYGLWQIGDITPSPGVWATDLVTGVERYLETPASALTDMGPWGVWLGAAVPVDGIWRLTGTGMRLTPAEGDAAAEYAEEATMVIVRETAGVPVSPPLLRIGDAEPIGARWDYEEPASADMVELTSKVVSVVAVDIVAQVAVHRATPPQLSNTDDDPMRFIEARVAVGPDVRDRLLSHPEFDAEGETIHWWGTERPGVERDASSGTLTVEGDETLRVSVNSLERMERLLRRLRTLGLDPVVTSQASADPDQGFAWPSMDPGLLGAEPSAEDWKAAWLTVQVPALGRKTLREAASGSLEDRILVESLLRRLEHDAHLRAVAGEKTVDVRLLRAELGLLPE